jgi:flavin reductase (DIM6/NTAB) family NADH-FMN oxidoreductase RutF
MVTTTEMRNPSSAYNTFFDLRTLSPRGRYKLLLSTIVPRPIAWIVTLDREGRVNLAAIWRDQKDNTDRR